MASEAVEKRRIEIVATASQAGATIKQMEQGVKALNAQLRDLTPGTDTFIKKSKELDQAKARLEGVKQEAYGIGKALQETAKNSVSFKSIFTSVVGALTLDRLIGEVINLGLESLKLARVYSDSFADIQKSTGMTSEEVRQLNEDLGKINTRTAQQELLSIAKVGGQLGVAKEEILGFTEAVDKAVVALGDEFAGGAEEVGKSVGGLARLFKDTKALDAGKAINDIGSAINALGAAGSANGPFMTDFAQRIAGLGNLAPTAAQALGLAAALQELGETSENAASGSKEIITLASKDIPAFAKQMGITNQELKNLLNNDPNQVILRLSESFKGASNTKIVDTLTNLNIKSIQGQGVMMKLANNVEFVKEKQKLANDEMKRGTSLTQEFTIKNNTAAAQAEKNAKKWEARMLQLGEVLLPVYTLITDVFEGVFNVLAEGYEFVRPTIESFLHTMAELGRSMGLTGTAGEWLGKIFGFIGDVLKVALIPFKLGLTIITALAGGFAHLYKESALFHGIVDAILLPVTSLIKLLKGAKDILSDFTGGVEKLFGLSGKEVKTKVTTEKKTTNQTTNADAGEPAGNKTEPVPPIIDTDLTGGEKDLLEKEKKEKERAEKEAERKRKQKEKQLEDFRKAEEDFEKEREKFRAQELAADQELETMKLALMDGTQNAELIKLKSKHEKELAEITKLESDIRNNKALSEAEKTAMLQKYTDQRLLIDQKYANDVQSINEAQALREKELQNQLLLEKAEQKIIEAEGEDAEFAAQMEKRQLELDLQREMDLANKDLSEAELAAIEAQYTTQSKALAAEKAEFKKQKEREIKDAAIQLGQEVLGAIGDFSRIATDKKIAQAERAKNEELKKLDEQLKSGKITQEQYDAAKQQAEEAHDKKTRDAKRKQAKLDKQLALVNAVIATALAVVKALPNIPLSILAGVTGGLGIAKIAATPLPEFAEGGSTIQMAMVDGKWQMARNRGSFASGGHVGNTSYGIIGEKGAEWVAPNWMMRSPQYANVIGYLEAARVRGYATGGATASVGLPAGAASGSEEFARLTQRMDLMIGAFTAYAQRVEQWQTQLEVHNNVGETDKGIKTLNLIRSEGSITG